MDFWSDFSKAVSKAANNTVKETERLTTIAKLRYRVSTVNSKIDNYYKTLGEMKYAEYKGDEFDSESANKICEEIDSLKKTLEALDKRINEMSEYINCPQCGYKVRKEATVCPYCGVDMPKTDNNDEKQEDVVQENTLLPDTKEGETAD